MTDAPWRDDPLTYLIGPTDSGDFFTRVFENEALIVRRDDPERYASLLSVDRIDELVSGRAFLGGEIEVVRADGGVQRSDFVDANGDIDRGSVAHHYQAGGTIILNQLHNADPTLTAFCRAVQQVFSAHVQTNVYMTPPHGKGFRTHYDSHDVFVIQVTGEKTWRLYDSPMGTPFRGERFAPGSHDINEPVQTFQLKAGDCAYVPRGLMHDAETAGDEPSLHITVGIIVRTWADLVLEAVSEVALNEPDFRRALPPGFARAGADRTATRATFAKLIAAVAAKAEPNAALDLFSDSFTRNIIANTRGAITFGAQDITNTNRFQIRLGLCQRIANDGDKLAVVAPGGDLSFAADWRSSVERALDGTAFTLSDLEPLSTDDAIEMVRRMLAFGLIETA